MYSCRWFIYLQENDDGSFIVIVFVLHSPMGTETKEVELPKETKEVQDEDEEEEDVELVFKPLLILSVILSSFAYGSIIVRYYHPDTQVLTFS